MTQLKVNGRKMCEKGKIDGFDNPHLVSALVSRLDTNIGSRLVDALLVSRLDANVESILSIILFVRIDPA